MKHISRTCTCKDLEEEEAYRHIGRVTHNAPYPCPKFFVSYTQTKKKRGKTERYTDEKRKKRKKRKVTHNAPYPCPKFFVSYTQTKKEKKKNGEIHRRKKKKKEKKESHTQCTLSLSEILRLLYTDTHGEHISKRRRRYLLQ